MNNIFILLILFQAKHYVCDFPLQGEYMLKKFSPNWDFFIPLLSHALVHAFFTFAISVGFVGAKFAAILGVLDLVIHFSMDRIKASPKMLGKYQNLVKSDFEFHSKLLSMYTKAFEEEQLSLENYKLAMKIEKDSFNVKKASNKKFWHALGLDQAVHHLTHYLIIYLIVTR